MEAGRLRTNIDHSFTSFTVGCTSITEVRNLLILTYTVTFIRMQAAILKVSMIFVKMNTFGDKNSQNH